MTKHNILQLNTDFYLRFEFVKQLFPNPSSLSMSTLWVGAMDNVHVLHLGRYRMVFGTGELLKSTGKHSSLFGNNVWRAAKVTQPVLLFWPKGLISWDIQRLLTLRPERTSSQKWSLYVHLHLYSSLRWRLFLSDWLAVNTCYVLNNLHREQYAGTTWAQLHPNNCVYSP